MRGLKTLLFITTAICSLVSLYGQNHIEGIVYDDRNGNGQRERGERPLRNIPVSNGDTIVLTDRKGHFELPIQPGQSVFAIAPAGRRTVSNGTASGYFFHLPDNDTVGPLPSLSFALAPCETHEKFRMAAVGDMQVDNRDELAYAQRTVLSELSGRSDVAFSLMMGDLVNDNHLLLRPVDTLLRLLPHPVWCVVGNHDLDAVPRGSRQPRLHREFCNVFGAADYIFDFGPVRFVVLDNNSHGFGGRFTDNQLRLIRNVIAITPNRQQLVFAFHVPLAATENGSDLLDLLGNRPALILSAHLHTIERHIWRPGIAELIVGATCGSWWVGERDPDAVPVALQQCGSPRNYFLIDFSADGYRFTFKGVGLDKTRQMEFWISGEEIIDREIPALREIPVGTVAVNLYGGCETSQVEMSVDGDEWIPMVRTPMVAPTVSRVAYWNRHAGYPTKFSRRIPLRRTASPHIWTAQLPDQAMQGPHLLRVRATDEYGLSVEQSRIFTIR